MNNSHSYLHKSVRDTRKLLDACWDLYDSKDSNPDTKLAALQLAMDCNELLPSQKKSIHMHLE